jgi:hypothetical protein
VSLLTTIDAMLAAGCTAEQLAAVVRAHEAGREIRAAEKRAKDAERQRRHRESRNVTVTTRDNCDLPLPDKERSPTPPKEINPSPSKNPSDFYPAPAARVRDFRFDEFYEAYPKHVDRKAAEKKLQTIVRGGVDPETLIDGARRYAADCRAKSTDPQYIKSPLVWLNKGCWLDEIGPAATGALPFAQPPPKRTDAEIRAIAMRAEAEYRAANERR